MKENPDLAVVVEFAEELSAIGVKHVVLSPGSRSTPLTVAFARNPSFHLWNILDERSAGYFALGMARAAKSVVVLVCTSGTAAANYLPAVVEAHYSRIPLLVLTADRPPELLGVGSNQTIVQQNLYGPYVKWHAVMPVPEASVALLRHARGQACRAVAEAMLDAPGPVHLNWPFREPLLPPKKREAQSEGIHHACVTPVVRIYAEKRGAPHIAQSFGAQWARNPRGLIVCGPSDDEETAQAAIALSRKSGWPLLADPLSQARAHVSVHKGVIAQYDTLLRAWSQEQRLAAQPDLIVRTGAAPTSKVLGECLQLWRNARQAVVDEAVEYRDPFFSATDVIQANAGVWLSEFARSLPERGVQMEEANDYAALWQSGSERIRAMTATYMRRDEELSEGRIVLELADLLEDGAWLMMGNSMPIRDLDSFLPALQTKLHIVANRGVSGIDGVISSALGTAAIAGDAVTLVIGDLSFLHDIGGLLAAVDHGVSLTIIVIQNDGGGIFSYLPQAGEADVWSHFSTPHGIDIRHAAQLYKGHYTHITSWTQFREEVRDANKRIGWSLLEVCTDRDVSLRAHRELWDWCKQELGGDLSATRESR